MDQLTAYHVLGIKENASKEEIKEAYASLSKVYHPEENPEEFQHIHEAYITLTRRNRRNLSMSVDTVSLEQNVTPKEQTKSKFDFETAIRKEIIQEEEIKEEKTNVQLDFSSAIRKETIQREEIKQQFDFEASIQKGERQEREKTQQDTIQLLEELQVLFTPPNCHKRKHFVKFFERKEYENIFYAAPFIDALATHINERKLKAGVYSFLVQFYKLKRVEVERLVPEAQRLYRIIQSRYDIQKDIYVAAQQGGIYGVIGGGASILIRHSAKILRVFKKAFATNELVMFAIFIFCVIVIAIVLYKLLRRK